MLVDEEGVDVEGEGMRRRDIEREEVQRVQAEGEDGRRGDGVCKSVELGDRRRIPRNVEGAAHD